MERRLQGTRCLVLAEELYEDLELWYPVLRLREEGAVVTIAGTGAKQYSGKHGYPVTVDTQVDQVSSADYDALIIPGGYAPDRLRRSTAAIRIVREMAEQGKVVAAICHAAWLPISAGIVKGKRMTCFFSIKDDVINAGGHYVDQEVVRDGLFITSRGPDDLGAFCRAIIDAAAEGGQKKSK